MANGTETVAVVVGKSELVTRVAEEVNVTQKIARQVIDSLVGQIGSALEGGNTVRVSGLGTFRVITRAARKGVNPQTGDKINIPAVSAPAFKYSSTLKTAVKEALPVKVAKKATKK